ncbi:hypothetical protein NDU88_004623 [Pleurodeles waltl]|uniref:Uncharacterized protein n=1 Tax=Pleurodeles waltl TaxID=8319 RepID=A0AAV7M7M5_PLEWA|nr:hypothetical protein NDU88_004623 [Pleurodeles waltl]
MQIAAGCLVSERRRRHGLRERRAASHPQWQGGPCCLGSADPGHAVTRRTSLAGEVNGDDAEEGRLLWLWAGIAVQRWRGGGLIWVRPACLQRT